MLTSPPDPSLQFAAAGALRPEALEETALEEDLIVTERFLWRRKAVSRRLQKCRIKGQEKAPDFAPRFVAPRLKSTAPEFDQTLAELMGHILLVPGPDARRRERAFIVTGCVLVALLGTSAAAIMIRGPEGVPDSPVVQMSRAETEERQDVLHRASKVEDATALLAAFFKAQTAAEKAPLVQGGMSLLPVLEDYYSRHPDEPAGFECTNTACTSCDGREFYFIGGVLENGAWVEAAVEDTASGLKLHWSYLKGAGDLEWRQWIETHPREPVSMRVMARLDDFYSGPFSDAEEWLCVKITDLAGTSAAWAYIARDCEDGETLSRKLTNRSEPLRLRASFAFPSPLPPGAERAPQVSIRGIAPRGWLEDGAQE